MAEWTMEDIKIITVILGDGGKVAVKFNDDIGELRIFPNELANDAPDECTLYELVPEARLWCIGNDVTQLEKVNRND